MFGSSQEMSAGLLFVKAPVIFLFSSFVQHAFAYWAGGVMFRLSGSTLSDHNPALEAYVSYALQYVFVRGLGWEC